MNENEKDKALYQFQKAALLWIKNMLLYDEIRLKDVPDEIRTADPLIYVTAFRISRSISCKRYIKDLQTLCRDIHLMSGNTPIKEQLLRTLSNALQFHNFQEEQDFVDFQKNIYEDVLYQLQRKKGAVQRHLQTEFEKQRIQK